jgi:hypothetical protein
MKAHSKACTKNQGLTLTGLVLICFTPYNGAVDATIQCDRLFSLLVFIFISSSSIVAVEEAMDTASRISCATNISADSSENRVYLGLRYQGKIGILFSASIFDYIYIYI